MEKAESAELSREKRSILRAQVKLPADGETMEDRIFAGLSARFLARCYQNDKITAFRDIAPRRGAF
jgi:hypothetical protein